jgi:hypothetical protein
LVIEEKVSPKQERNPKRAIPIARLHRKDRYCKIERSICGQRWRQNGQVEIEGKNESQARKT